MSTKWLLIGGDEFQLYQELFDDGFIYLELSQTHFEANPRSVQVRIPIEIWETIRHHGGPDLSLLQKSDEEIRALVEQAVDARIRAHNEGRPMASFGVCTYGSVETSREEQIAAGIATYQAERKKLRHLSSAIDEMKRRSASTSPRKDRGVSAESS